ncbi:Coagulation factor XI like protein [Argiope bruennichi]|uniref:Coagulation factor XI like protein n=1 Tax=Argiope bruennichi TaxID=94029 RepID=A0A8T0ENT2_ARGBR|nr:Coagulation factor XI like protein [Argiope bruennichi]
MVRLLYSKDNEVSLKDARGGCATQPKNSEFGDISDPPSEFHPKFGNTANIPIYDIALLKLKDTIIFRSAFRPICLTDNKNLEKPGLNATVIGWGKMEQGGNSTRRLKKVVVPLVETAYCQKKLHKHKKSLGNFTICAGGKKFEDACEDLEKCRSYPESMLVKQGKIDGNKLSSHHIVEEKVLKEPLSFTELCPPLSCSPSIDIHGYILVAASYSEDNEVSLKDASVAVATQSKNSEFVTFRIHQVKFHPKFGTYGEYPIYDIALLKLKDTIIFSKRIRPICLTDNKNLEKPGLNATVIGWGKMEQGNSTRRLKKVVVPLVETAYCQKKLHKHKKSLGNFTICAGGKKFEDACEGDSGGPLQIQDDCNRWNLLGLASWGEGCGVSKKPGVYSRVQFFLKWILKETLDGMSCDFANYERIEPNLKECGMPSYRYMKTGIPVQILTFPFMANLYYGHIFLGSGVLINSTVVLTTTSVVKPWGPSLKALNFTVHFGSPAHYLNASDYLYERMYVKEIIFHPMAGHRFDLCLVVLGVAMADSLMKFHPVCFSNFKMPFRLGDEIQISAYTGGFLHSFKTASGEIRKFSRCRPLKYGAFFKYRSYCVQQTTKNFSPHAFDNKWRESCQGEIGAVITAAINGRHYLLGISSTRPDKCTSPRIFHDINWALPWIRTICTMLDVA